MTPARPLLTTAEHGSSNRPLIVTDDPELREDLLRLAAAAGAVVTVAPDAAAARRHWEDAPLVLVGVDRAVDCVAAELPRRRDVVLVGTDLADQRTWSLAVLVSADHVVFLPDAEPWLVDMLSAASRSAGHSLVVGVVGGRGGIGATTLAVSLARAGLRRKIRTVLVEADPLGGLAVGPDARGAPPPDGFIRAGFTRSAFADPDPAAAGPAGTGPAGIGPAVPDQAGADRAGRGTRGGDIRDGGSRGGNLEAGLPGWPGGSGYYGPDWSHRPWTGDDEIIERLLAGATTSGDTLPVLSWDRDVVPVLPPPAVGAMFATARGVADLVVVDLPRSTDPACEVGLFLCQTVLVVLTPDRAAREAAARVCAHVRTLCSDVRAVVRSPRAGRQRALAAAQETAASLGVPLAGVIHEERGADPATMAAPAGRRTSRPAAAGLAGTRDTGAGEAGGNGGDGRVGASLTRFGEDFLAAMGMGVGAGGSGLGEAREQGSRASRAGGSRGGGGPGGAPGNAPDSGPAGGPGDRPDGGSGGLAGGPGSSRSGDSDSGGPR